VISIVGETTTAQAFAIVQLAELMISEDSGLMHMGWVSGIKTIALFGSTRSDWAQPLGRHARFFDSSDLPCGNCMREICAYGDNHCLTRYTPAFIFEQARALYLTGKAARLLPVS
jgi:ADP-heptose:LPS heptosyltransferase